MSSTICIKLWVVYALGCREGFPRHRLKRKPLVSCSSMPSKRVRDRYLIRSPWASYQIVATHVPWCMLGSLTCGGGENVPGIPGACVRIRRVRVRVRKLYLKSVQWKTIAQQLLFSISASHRLSHGYIHYIQRTYIHKTEDEISSTWLPNNVITVTPQVAITTTHGATTDDKSGQTDDPNHQWIQQKR